MHVGHKKNIRFQYQKAIKTNKQTKKSIKQLKFSNGIKNKPSTKIKIQPLKWDLNSVCILCPADPC